MTRYNIYFLFLLAIAVFLPHSSEAYYTTQQQAVRVTNNAAIFQITYRFGSQDQDLYMPIFAERNLEHRATRHRVGFELLENSAERTNTGIAAGVVLSDAEVVGNHYVIPAGEARDFTLLVVLKTLETDPAANLATRVTSLPWEAGTNKRELQLNQSELQYYITPEVALNSNETAPQVILAPNGK